MQRAGDHSALGQCLKTLKTNHNVLWLYLEILKANQRFTFIFDIMYQTNTKQLRYSLGRSALKQS